MPKDTRKMLAEMVRAAGQELIEKADEIIGDPLGPYIGYKITIDIKSDTDEMNVPIIEVNRSFISEYAMDAKLKAYNEGD